VVDQAECYKKFTSDQDPIFSKGIDAVDSSLMIYAYVHAIAFSGHGVTFQSRLHFDIRNHISTRSTLHCNVRRFGSYATRCNDNAHSFNQLRDIFGLEQSKLVCSLFSLDNNTLLNVGGAMDGHRS
jgi:hypothetical protein